MQVLDAMEYAVYRYDVEHVIIDNLQFMLSGQGASSLTVVVPSDLFHTPRQDLGTKSSTFK